jgi:hypothetical protein
VTRRVPSGSYARSSCAAVNGCNSSSAPNGLWPLPSSPRRCPAWICWCLPPPTA